MSIFGLPSPKEVDNVKQKVLFLTEDLLKKIDEFDWKEKSNNSIFSSQLLIFFYVLEVYRQLLTVKHTKTYSLIICNTIIISLESNYKLTNKEFQNLFHKVQQQMYNRFKHNKFDSIASSLLQELGFTELELQAHQLLIQDISNFFDEIINTPTEYIL